MSTKTNSVKIREYDWLVLISMVAFLVSLFYFIFFFFTSWREIMRVSQVIEYGNEVSSIEWTHVLEWWSINETNRWYENTIKIRENKLSKLKQWSSKEKTEILNRYKTFYDLQISKTWQIDYHHIATEIAWIWNKLWIRILGISLWNATLSRNITFNWDSRYQIYERPVTIDIAKTSDIDFSKDSIKSYDKLKEFLKELRNDVKMPFNWWFELAKQSDQEDTYEDGNVKFDRVNLLFFYNHKK